MGLFDPAPEPKTALGRYRKFSPAAGVHLFPLALGAMSIEDKRGEFMGAMGQEQSRTLLNDIFVPCMDCFDRPIDGIGDSQDETSEEFVGEWAEERGIRDQLFIVTKYTTNYKRLDPAITQKVNYTGNNVKSMHIFVEASLKNLRTSYIDLLYVHWRDRETSIEEVMQGLHTLVLQGKGISGTPAWSNVMERSFERDIIPMALSEGVALCPWTVLAGGKIRTDEEGERRRTTGEKGRTLLNPNWERSEKEKNMHYKLQHIATEVGTKGITSVAIAYLMEKTPYVSPLVGGRSVEHWLANIEALTITLSSDHIKSIEAATDPEFDMGFPTTLVGTGSEIIPLMASAATIDENPPLRPFNLLAAAPLERTKYSSL
ncbi:Aldo/keto reductase [Coprinellus micaceus]|uniref:Aldo/keto reductase n=1 Tax=Coprinellus micaceus TaxID=71717 RepID=A0A4Y7TVI2_COPMI|nr:Aldo/keto reductase [Coprinellus micaceus]